MNVPPVSVVIVSRDRPDYLRRCLTGVLQLRYPNFEIVVAADRDSLGHVPGELPAGRIKTVQVDDANIALARNLACDAAAGEIVAFVDDDAVPETSCPRIDFPET